MDRKTSIAKSNQRVGHGSIDNDAMERDSSRDFTDGDTFGEWYTGSKHVGGGRERHRLEHNITKHELRDYDTNRNSYTPYRNVLHRTPRTSPQSQYQRFVERGRSYVFDDVHHDWVDSRDGTRLCSLGVEVLPDRRALVGQHPNTTDNSEQSMNQCRPMPKWAMFYLNILMHISILMTILTLLFFTIIASAERDALQSQIKDGLESTLAPFISQTSAITPLLDKIPTSTLQRIMKSFESPDFYITQMNNRLTVQAITMCVILVATFIGSYVALRFSCGFCSEIAYLILENLCTFAFVGIIEYMFFTNVALHFVPTLPSFFVTSILETTKAILLTFNVN